MKRKDLIKYLKKNGCEKYREGSKHTLFINPSNKKISTVPRHREIKNDLCRKICKDLGIGPPKSGLS
jgi:predicted RNA binding protein YcfA (HicA-like mRNA interferase family)